MIIISIYWEHKYVHIMTVYAKKTKSPEHAIPLTFHYDQIFIVLSKSEVCLNLCISNLFFASLMSFLCRTLYNFRIILKSICILIYFYFISKNRNNLKPKVRSQMAYYMNLKEHTIYRLTKKIIFCFLVVKSKI